MHLRADPAAVRPCRRWAAQFATRHGASARTEEVVALLTSELVSNAVKYGPATGTIDLDADYADGAVRISVSDDEQRPPMVLDPPPTAPGGRGMRLVEVLSHAWGVVQHPGDGKTVWFEVKVGPA